MIPKRFNQFIVSAVLGLGAHTKEAPETINEHTLVVNLLIWYSCINETGMFVIHPKCDRPQSSTKHKAVQGAGTTIGALGVPYVAESRSASSGPFNPEDGFADEGDDSGRAPPRLSSLDPAIFSEGVITMRIIPFGRRSAKVAAVSNVVITASTSNLVGVVRGSAERRAQSRVPPLACHEN